MKDKSFFNWFRSITWKRKPILLYTEHRQTIPIIQENKKDFVLINFVQLWKFLRIFGKTNSSKLRAKVYYLILKTLKPEVIIDINWIGRVAIIHQIYSRNNKVKFVVVQHGFYTGGYISNRFPEGRWHKMARCTHFWIWSEYISGEVLMNNSTFFVNGNPLYNDLIKFKQPFRRIEKVKTILIAPTNFTLKEGEKLDKLMNLVSKLVDSGVQVFIKLHHLNELFPKLENIIILENINFYEVLYKQEFDLIIADHSTTLLDAMFFNNLVAFCNFHNSPNTLYEKLLGELNIESIEHELEKCLLPDRIELQNKFLNYLGLNNPYSNSLRSIIN